MDEEDLLAVTLGGPTSVNAQSSSTFDPNDPYGEFGSPVNGPNANPLGLLSNLLTTATGSVVANQGIQRQEQLGRQAVALADQLIADTERRGTFRPFTVTTDLATTATTPEGGFGVTLGQTPRDIQDQALTQALSGIQGLGTSRSQREQEIFDRLEAIRQPQRNRELQGLLNAENAAGRLGLCLDDQPVLQRADDVFQRMDEVLRTRGGTQYAQRAERLDAPDEVPTEVEALQGRGGDVGFGQGAAAPDRGGTYSTRGGVRVI